MKNTKLTKDMKHNIARAMYDVYHNKTMEYWWEFVQEIKAVSYTHLTLPTT